MGDDRRQRDDIVKDPECPLRYKLTDSILVTASVPPA
jgi:hypothetical protein